MFYLTIERLRQSDDTGARVDDEMVRELYAIFHRRSFGIVALQDEHFRPDLGRFRKRQARGVSPGLQDRWLVHVVTHWNSKKKKKRLFPRVSVVGYIDHPHAREIPSYVP